MALVNIFMSMSFLCGGIAIGSLIITKLTHMNNSNVAIDAASYCGIFGALALVGLLFV